MTLEDQHTDRNLELSTELCNVLDERYRVLRAACDPRLPPLLNGKMAV